MRNFLLTVVSLMSMVAVSHLQMLEKETCDAKRLMVDVSTTNANAILGAIFEIRDIGTGDDGYGCGQPHKDLLLSYEAARYAIKLINNQNYIPGVRLGMKAYDTCYSQYRALSAVQNFYPQAASSSMYCTESQTINLGIVGTLTSWTGKPVAEYTSKINASVISPRSASSLLSQNSKYPYFMRTGLSSTFQVKAMLAVLKDLGWERVVLVHSVTDYGYDSAMEFIRQAQMMDICITKEYTVPQKGSTSDYVSRLSGIGDYGVAAAVYFGDLDSAQNVLNSVSSVSGADNLQWVMSSFRTVDSPSQTPARGAIAVLPKFTRVTEFYNDFVNNMNENNPSPENPWLQEWFMTMRRCRLTGINYAPYNLYPPCTPMSNADKLAMLNQDYPFVDSTIMAVYAYARALKTAQETECGVGGGFCLALQRMTPEKFHKNYLSQVDFTFGAENINIPSLQNVRVKFDANGDIITSDYYVWNYNDVQTAGTFKFVQAGSYENGQLTLNNGNLKFYTAGGNPSSRCPPEGCQQCLIPHDMVQFEHEPGDILIGGIFDIHGDGIEPLSCGELKYENAHSAVAFRYAIKTAKNVMPNILQGVDLGGLVADACSSGMSARLLFYNLLGERHIVKDKMGHVIDPNKMTAVVDYLNSDDAMQFAEMSAVFHTPQVATSATSVALSDKEMFPYFNRVLPPDNKQVSAMVQLLKRLGWTYIQTIQKGNNYGRTGIQLLKDNAAYEGICVTASYEIGTHGDYAQIVSSLQNRPDARAVVIFASSADVRGILEAVKARYVPGQFVFIGSETWGSDTSVTAGLEDVASGSFSIGIESFAMQGFNNWLSGLNPLSLDVQQDMPFFVDWYQYAHNCYIDPANRGLYSSSCTGAPITAGQNYKATSSVYFVINAVYAVANALDETLRLYCGNGYTQICSAFRSSKYSEYGNYQLNYNIGNTNIMTEGGRQFEIANGEGMADYIIYNFDRQSGYVQAGRFDTATSLLNLDISSVTFATGTFTSKCASRCGECAYTLQQFPFLLDRGTDIKLGVIMAASNPSSDPFLCGDVRIDYGMQQYYATSYALWRINEGLGPVDLNPGVELGALFMDHCNSQSKAYGLPNGLYAGIISSPSQSEPNPSLDTIRGWMTDNTLGAEELKDLVKSMNLPLISPSATSSSLMNDDEFPTFYRTVKGDITVSSAIAKLLKSLDLPYISVLYSANSFGRDGKEAFTNVASQEGICVVQAYEMKADTVAADLVTNLISQPTHVVVVYLGASDIRAFLEARNNNPSGSKLVIISPEPWTILLKELGGAAQNLLSVTIKSTFIDDFRDYLDSTELESLLTNPYLRMYYEDSFKCNLPGNNRFTSDCRIPLIPLTSSPLFAQENYVVPIINAVNAWSSAVHETLKDKCGADYDSVCMNFLTDEDTNSILLSKLAAVSFEDDTGETFTFKDREGSTGHEIHLFDGNQYSKVGEFAGASVLITAPNLLTRFDKTESSCPSPCIECIINTMEFTYIPGDILLGGLFDVHDAALSPFSCGNIKTWHGFQLLEAFHYAINKVNDKSGNFAEVLKNIKLGGIGLDSCESAIRTGFLVSNIHKGLSVLQRGGDTIDPDDINVYIGSYSSDQSIHLARLMKTLEIPQISYASSSMSLDDVDRYPYFMRTVPGDDKQSIAMMDFLSKFDIRYVQIIHTSSNYGEQAAAIFSKLAKERKICIAQSIVFPDNGTVSQETANDVVTALLNKPVANTVIVFANAAYINELLRAVARKPEAINKFKFIGSDTWANNVEATAGVEAIAEKSVTLDLEVLDLLDFDTYLSTKTPANYPENPWFSEYYQEIENCYLTSRDRRYPERCPATPGNIVASRRYKQDTAILHVINAVYAAAHGIDKALKEVCGTDYTTVCEAFKNLQDRRDVILRNIKEVEFVDPSGQNFEFVDGRNGNKGYVMYSIEPSVTFGYVYSQVGSYNNLGVLTTNQGYSPPWDGSCTRPDACLECPTVRNILTRYMLQPPFGGTSNPATIVAAMNVHGSAGANTYRCGGISSGSGFLNALAFFYTLDNFVDRSFGVRGLVVDLCGQRNRIDQDAYSLLSSGTLCNSDFNTAGNIINNSTIVGFLTTGSINSVEANRILSPLQIPFISYSASSVALKDQEKYPYFARVVPPDDKQTKVIAHILKEMNWNYISVVYTTEPFGISGEAAFRRNIQDLQASCIGLTVPISSTATVEDAKEVVRQLMNQRGADVVVLIALNPPTIVAAADALGVADKFTWIGTDIWGRTFGAVRGRESKMVGSITVEFRNAHINNLKAWIEKLKYDNRYFIPDDWFEEFYQVMHKCYLLDAVVVKSEYPTQCSKTETFDTSTIQPRLMMGTMAATYAMGKGLYDFRLDFCGSKTFTECLETVEGARDKLFQNILNVEWQMNQDLDLTPDEEFHLKFNDERYWNVGYKINQFVRDGDSYKYVELGRQIGDEPFQLSNVQTYRDVISSCPADQPCDCNYGAAAESQAQTSERILTRINKEPRNYYFYNEGTGEKVYQWPIWAIAVAVCTCLGLLIGLVLFFYFLVEYPVKGGTSALGFLVIFGILCIYALNFAFFYPASEETCIARRFCMGVVYTIVFASLFIKSVDNWRFSGAEYITREYRGLTSSCSLFMMALGIICIEIIIPIEWLTLVKPTASKMSDSTINDWMWCDPPENYDLHLVLSMVFVMVLLLLTAIFSALSWDSESNYYESRWIFVSTVCTAGCMMVWMIVSTNAGPPYRDPAIAISNFVNATALLICIPIRKLALLCYVRNIEEKEKELPDGQGQELYSTVYPNQAYEPDVFQNIEPKRGSDQEF